MIEVTSDLISPDLTQKIFGLESEIENFRLSPLDRITLEKLREQFKTHHIYHSAGIEGNRLTLQETALVLNEGIDISGRPLGDSIEVKNLGVAFDFLYELAQKEVPITENYIKQIHQLIVGGDVTVSPGEYRNIGVIITGSEHRPPEPFEVPIRMMELVEWIIQNWNKNPVILAALAHHEFVRIHPFKDGNGRTGRILLNLILLKKGFPICNIRRDERVGYYNALSIADEGNYEPIVEVVAENCIKLFSEYIRLRDESNQLKEWAQRLGSRDREGTLLKLKTEFQLWQNKVNQVMLEFKQAVVTLNENLETYDVSFYEYPQLTFEKYIQLKEKGIASGTNFFSIRIHYKETNRIIDTFMFRFFRSGNKYPNKQDVIPFELNYFDTEKGDFNFIGYHPYAKGITLRAFYVNNSGEIVTRYTNPGESNPNYEYEINERPVKVVMDFFDQIFKVVIRL